MSRNTNMFKFLMATSVYTATKIGWEGKNNKKHIRFVRDSFAKNHIKKDGVVVKDSGLLRLKNGHSLMWSDVLRYLEHGTVSVFMWIFFADLYQKLLLSGEYTRDQILFNTDGYTLSMADLIEFANYYSFDLLSEVPEL